MTRLTGSALLDALLSDGMHHCAHSEEKGVTMTIRANGNKRAFQLAAPDPHGDIAEWAQERAEGVLLPLSIGAGARGRCIVPAFVAEIDMARSRMRSGEKLIDARDLEKALSAEKLRPSIIARQGRKAFALWLFKEPQSMSFKERGEKYHSFLDSMFPDWEDVETPRSPFEMPLEAAGLEILNGNGPRYDLEELLPARTRAHGGDVLSIEAVQEELAARGWTVRHNVITNAMELSGNTPEGHKAIEDDFVARLHSDMNSRYKKCTGDALRAYLGYISRANRYNPVLDYIKSVTWDGEDRISDLFTLLGVEEDDLSKTLVRKWLWQGIALLHNDGEGQPLFSSDGVLVLYGGQGLGKTSFFAALSMKDDWFGDGLRINEFDKDTERRVVTTFIAELGEVSQTMTKADENYLKALITKRFDVYRLPYAHSDTQNGRHTNICATTNDQYYLTDPTGSRRWWTVVMGGERIPHELLEAPHFDALQIWAQAYHEVMTSGLPLSACFRLTPDEQDALAIRNGFHRKAMRGEDEVLDILERAKADGYDMKHMTVKEWVDENPVLIPIGVRQVGVVLEKLGYTSERVGKDRTRMRLLPTKYKTKISSISRV